MSESGMGTDREQGAHTGPVERSVATDGLISHMLDWGTPGRPGVVFLDEMADDARRRDGCPQAWRDAFHVVALGRRDHRQLAKSLAAAVHPDTWAARSDDVLRVADALGWGRFSVVGQAAGGSSGIYLAAEHPERIDRLAISDIKSFDLWIRLQDVRCPTLLIQRAEGTDLQLQITERMSQEIADCRLVVLPPAGRSPTMAEGQAYEAAIRDFLLGKEPVGGIRPDHDVG